MIGVVGRMRGRFGDKDMVACVRRFWVTIIACLLATPALAHDFWLQPQHFNLAPGASTSLTILVGHGPFRSRWSGAIDRIVLMRSYGPNGVVDQKNAIRPTSEKDGDIGFQKPGTYVLAFQSSYAESNLPFIRYNDYIKVEGLTPAIAFRERTKTTETPGREIYSRRAKALIQVGKPTGPQPWVTRPVGLSLEIVPDKNPYTLAPNEELPVHVLYEGRPLAGALVKLTNLEFDERPVAMHLSDAQGRASFSFPRTGTWLINVIWTKPITGNPKAEFDTTFSSLTFGYGGGTPH
jgi:uncharacterized GH25 family protein